MSGVGQSVSNETGILHVVATPIGNLGDLSPRAVATLGAVDLIAAEDTRHSRRLLDHAGIDTPMVSLHEHNERERCASLVARLAAGESIALISDAGTPLVSDPGFRLVREARTAGIEVRAVPGPSAALAALSIAGLPSDRFAFEGFLPAKDGARRTRLDGLADEIRTLIFFVTPRRLAAELQAAAEVFGAERKAFIARELTKNFESGYSGTLSELLDQCHSDASMQKGEMVLVVGGAEPKPDAGETDQLLRILLDEVPLKTAVSLAMQISGLPRNILYRRAVELQQQIQPKGEN